MKVLGISGSLRAGSHNTALLRAAASALPPAAELELYGGLAEIPPYSEDDQAATGDPVAVRRLKQAIAGADAVLFATPEYNHSIPGQLKNALDWVSRPLAGSPLRGKPVAIIGASTGSFGAVWAQAELRKVVGALGAAPIDRELPIAYADEAFDANARLSDPDAAEALEEIVAELAAAAMPQPVAA